ncbi:phospholipid-transporting ATPase ABCA3-like [Planococcus citri]|uniref:phospholipid-transporting ATPase ABCA3-like n=1 Tax=Planococcus citri TaxID=170843 RepID=UPI0031F9BC18
MCFGVLGVDGSGKTTILKMMTAETTPTSGDASIQGISLTSDTKRYVSKIGYCPQTNPLMDELTGREMLALIASLRGISGYDSEVLIDQWISFLKMEKYQHRFCSTYSNGSKRKLCTALALLGNPKVVFLDEPTTDLDPVSTRRLHDIIKKCKSAGLIVVLASPNMEECEILCDRLTILVRGVMQCIGTLKDLKKQYAQGYSVTLKIHYDVTSADETFALEENMTNVFNPQYCELIEEQRGLLRYHISDPAVQWSDLFRNLEDIKNNNPIVEEYIATNTTLDDIFISFSQSEYDPNSSDYY